MLITGFSTCGLATTFALVLGLGLGVTFAFGLVATLGLAVTLGFALVVVFAFGLGATLGFALVATFALGFAVVFLGAGIIKVVRRDQDKFQNKRMDTIHPKFLKVHCINHHNTEQTVDDSFDTFLQQ